LVIGKPEELVADGRAHQHEPHVKREKLLERVKLERRKPKRIERVKQVEVLDDDDEGLDQYGMPIYVP
jgi:hypothetical protein